MAVSSAAVGVKLAAPERTVVSLVGDGSCLFRVPRAAGLSCRIAPPDTPIQA